MGYVNHWEAPRRTGVAAKLGAGNMAGQPTPP